MVHILAYIILIIYYIYYLPTSHYIHKNRPVILDSPTTYKNVHLRNKHLKYNHIWVKLEQRDCGILYVIITFFYRNLVKSKL